MSSSLADAPALRCLDRVLLRGLPLRRRCSYLLFALALAVALGSYQFISPVKTVVFLNAVGAQQEPIAKSLVLVALVPVLFVYGLLTSALPSQRLLVLTVCGLYSCAYLFITAALALSGSPEPWLAWLLYYATETRAVVLMPMIWSVLADVTSPEHSQQAFPAIFAVTQLGGIAGSLVAVRVRSVGGEVGLLLLQTGLFCVVAGLTWCATSLAKGDGELQSLLHEPVEAMPEVKTASSSSVRAQGTLETLRHASYGSLRSGFGGLWLLASKPYVLGIYLVSYANLMPRTVLDYQNAVLTRAAFPDKAGQIAFLGKVNLIINSCVAVVAFFGTRPFIERVGLGRSLLILPIVTFACLCLFCVHPDLWMSVWTLVISCVVAYGLNSPCKEMLYVRTSREIKYNAKSWSEMYGNHIMKLLGAQVNLWLNLESTACAPDCFREKYTLPVITAWTLVWLLAALHVSQLHSRLERDEGKVV